MAKYEATAQGLAALGRNGDTLLMHVNPQEVAGMAALFGIEPTTNPDTGLPEAFSYSSAIGGLLSNLYSANMGGYMSDMASDWIAENAPELLKDNAEELGLGAGALFGGLGSAAISAGTAAAFGDDPANAALAGGITGAGMGLYGGMEDYGAWRADATKPSTQGGVIATADRSLTANTPYRNAYTMKTDYQLGDVEANAFSPMEASAKPKSFLSNQWDAAKDNFDALSFGVTAQAMLNEGFNNMDLYKKQNEENERKQQELLAQAGIRPGDMRYSYTFRNYAGGGAVGRSNEFGIPTMVKIPQHMVDELRQAGGIESLMARDTNYQQGGYVNHTPFDPEEAYPQSLINKASHYQGASPMPHEVVQGYEAGGFVIGDGDGMSDDIPASIDGQEEVRVADGEVIIPKAIVDMFGVEAVDNMLKRVRMAAYGTEEQVNQDAGKEVVLDMLD